MVSQISEPSTVVFRLDLADFLDTERRLRPVIEGELRPPKTNNHDHLQNGLKVCRGLEFLNLTKI